MFTFFEGLLNSNSHEFLSLEMRGWGDAVFHIPPSQAHQQGWTSERNTVAPVGAGATYAKPTPLHHPCRAIFTWASLTVSQCSRHLSQKTKTGPQYLPNLLIIQYIEVSASVLAEIGPSFLSFPSFLYFVFCIYLYYLFYFNFLIFIYSFI